MALLLDSFLMSPLSGMGMPQDDAGKYTIEKLFLKRFIPTVSSGLP
jgi:hypothetical protein